MNRKMSFINYNKVVMSFIEFEQIIKFELNNVLTRGVVKNIYGGFTVSVVLDQGNIDIVRKLSNLYNTKNQIYGNTLYLKVKELSGKNEEELFNKGKQKVMVHFVTTGVYNAGGGSYLVFKVTKLCKAVTVEKETPENWDREIKEEEVKQAGFKESQCVEQKEKDESET